MKQSFIFIMLCIVVFGCKQKEIPGLLDSTPVFVFEGMIGTDSTLWEAGNKNVYMHTSYQKNAFGLYQLQGVLGQENCDTCEPFISVILNSNVSNGGAYNYDPSIWQMNAIINSFSVDTTLIVGMKMLTCSPIYTVAGTSYFWSDYSGNTTTASTFTFPYLGNANILMVTNDGNSVDSIYQKFANNGFSISDNVSLTIDTIGWITAVNNSAGNITWNWGDGSIDTGNAPKHKYSLAGKYTILTFVKNAPDSINLSNTIDYNNTSFLRHPSFSMQLDSNTTPKQNLKSAIITVKKNGKTYVSYKNNTTLNQSTKPILKILQSVDGENNPQGIKTKVINAEIDIYVYNITNNADSIKVKSTNMVMAVSVPN